MKVCIVGAGAIGGLLAVRLSKSGAEVTVVDQGPQLEAIQAHGLHLRMADGTEWMADNLWTTGDVAAVLAPDVIILAVKAHQLADVAPKLPRIFHSETIVVTVQNGIPWWYFQKHGGAFEGVRLSSLDPDGQVARYIPDDRIIGCVAYPAATVTAPGMIQHVEGNRFPLGELDGTITQRAMILADLLNLAGFKSFVIEDIRAELWLKAWGALSFNPISALTSTTMVDICRFPLTRTLVANMMHEAEEVAHKLGVRFRHTIEKRIAGAEQVGTHKTSMLQDVEAGRALEVEAVIGAISELGRLTETQCPTVDAIYACISLVNHRQNT